MPIIKITKERLLKVAYGAFRKYGYHGTSMADIANSAGILKGSLYHYFSSKESLLLAVLHSKEVYESLGSIKTAFYDKVEGAERLKLMLDSIDEKDFLDKGGCILGNIGLELSDSNPEAIAAIERVFSDWIDAVSHIYRTAFNAALSFDKAQFALKELQGAIMLTRIFGDSGYISETKENIMNSI